MKQFLLIFTFFTLSAISFSQNPDNGQIRIKIDANVDGEKVKIDTSIDALSDFDIDGFLKELGLDEELSQLNIDINTGFNFDWDEAALGYNAYSIIQTGKVEYGKSLPSVLQSFSDYKPALYAYLVIPTIAIFDLNTFAVRLPSAIFGILTVLATYFFVKELFLSRRDIALASAFLLAISPWHIQFSRIAFEANVGMALNVFGVLFFLKGLKKPIFL